MKIKEDCKVKIKDLSSGQYIGECVPPVDMEVESNSIIIIDGGLYCVEEIIKISEEEYEMRVWWQDALLVKDGVFHQSISDD